MKILFLISVLSFSLTVFAGNCEETWKKENAKNKVSEICQLEWPQGGIQLVKVSRGCSFPGKDFEDCYLLRSCDSKKEIGASLFRESVPLNSYCLSGKETEVMSSSQKNGPKAFIVCEGKEKPSSVRLSDFTGKQSKTCTFPFSKSLNK